MRIVSLAIEDFRAIKAVNLELGPGINVLYGPNDLGKSTLAAALRAALLVVPSSAEASSYSSWFSGANARVELVLVDADGHRWKVKKTFGSSSASSAELFHSKDGLTFSLDCKGRQVEERLRALLSWGIPGPGGKGAPRGAPESFLANALLGPQEGTDDILGQSLASDVSESGKLRLGKALASLAQDPLFKEVLTRAQSEFDQFFTDSGRRKGGKASPFSQAGERVKAVGHYLQQRRSQLEKSSTIENEVTGLRQEHAAAQAALLEAEAARESVRQRFERGEAREALAQRTTRARQALDEIETRDKRVATMTGDLEAARKELESRRSEHTAAKEAVAAQQEECRKAEAEVAAASGEEAAQRRELRKAQLDKRAAELAMERNAATAQQEAVRLALEARRLAAEAARTESAALLDAQKVQAERGKAFEAEQGAALQVQTARALAAFLRWRGALALRAEADKAEESARGAEGEATQKEAEAARIEVESKREEQALAARKALLPATPSLRALETLERDLEKAEAALGGGLSVVLHPLRPIEVSAAVDEGPAVSEPPIHEPLSRPRSFEAERSLHLSIAETARLEVRAGSAEARHALEVLRRRWEAEALPVLAKARLESLGDLGSASVALEREGAAHAERRRLTQHLRSEATNLRNQAGIHRRGALASKPSDDEIRALEEALGDHDRQQLEQHHAALQRPLAATAERLSEAAARAHRELQEALRTKDEQVRSSTSRLELCRKQSQDLEELHQTRVAALPSIALEPQDFAASRRVEELRIEQQEVAAQLQELAAQADQQLEQARQALQRVTKAAERTKTDEARAREALEQTNRRCSSLEGALGELSSQVEPAAHAAARAEWETLATELAALPLDQVASAADLELAKAADEDARSALEKVRDALLAREGALAHVGGAALREEVQRLEEARLVAEADERTLEVDADSWKLLRDTLREVENEEGTHLGRALAGPVTSRFEDLTRGRYRGLRLDATLKAEGIAATGTEAANESVLDSLSVGTRSQLAALVRLTIADQLQCTIVLDDHLVHTDVSRLSWFHELLSRIAVNAQILIITCRAQDYLPDVDLHDRPPSIDLAAGTWRAIDLGRVLERHQALRATGKA